MFADYTKSILADYRNKTAANALPLRLIQPTPASIKKECEAVCNERYQRKDEKALREFFDQGSDKVATLKAIKQCGTDSFKPLANFLKGSTGSTEDKNVELLAWLIDFEPRPFELGRRYDINSLEALENKKDKTPKVGDKQAVLTDQPVHPDHPGQMGSSKESTPSSQQNIPATSRFKTKKIIAIGGVIMAFVIVGIYWGRTLKRSTTIHTGPQACMFWADDHYQPISCSQKPENALVVPLDSEKLVHFRKITRPDTISENALGSVWYVKFRGAYEYYTSPGYHPIDTSLKLRLLTDYVLIKHIHPTQGAEKTSN
jgi:hypothetical protein